jgi:hypothetical protein
MTAAEQEKLEDLLRDPTRTNEQFNLLISAYCTANPVIYNCFGGIEKHIGLLLPDNILAQGGFIDMLNSTPYLTDEDYKQSELIGWLYQFYISEKKDEVFAKKGKYTPDEIPAATQIFTPNWIVKYMVENTVGRIYLDNNPYADDIRESMKYLVEPVEPTPEDAILKIDDLMEYKMIDAACGSGHILIEGFNLFYRMYLSEGYAPRTAIENILKKNIIGLDLDTRAKQLATFALLMTAAKLDKSFLDCKVMPRVLDFPEPFVFRGGLMKEFLAHYFLGGNQKIIEETEKALELMKEADSLGSIMKFDISPETRVAIEKSTNEWEKHEFINPDIKAAIPSMKVILALTDNYAAVVMNPPYMGSGNMNDVLSNYLKGHFSEGKADLCTTFMIMQAQRTSYGGYYANIVPPSWMFLSTFEGLRRSIVANQHIQSLLHLSRGVFGADFGSVSTVIQNKKTESAKGVYFRLIERTFQEFDQKHLRMLFENTLTNHGFRFFFASYSKDIQDIVFSDNGARIYYPNVSQKNFDRIPGCPIGYWLSETAIATFASSETLYDIAAPRQGLATGNNDRFLRFLWEVDKRKLGLTKWVPCTKGGGFRKWYGNIEYSVNWENNGFELKNYKDEKGKLLSRPQNEKYYFKSDGATWSTISSGKAAFRFFSKHWLFETKGSVCFPIKEDEINLLLGYLNSPLVNFYLKVFTPTMDYHEGPVGRLPYLRITNETISNSIEQFVSENVVLSKFDWDSHETSWDFKKNELIRAKSLCRQNGADLDMLSNDEIEELKKTAPYDDHQIDHCIRAYKSDWERKFKQLHSNEEELNRQFIDIYGLQDELTPDVPLDEITILQQGEISIVNNQITWHDDVIIKQLISYAIGCWMGRYRLDQEGLFIAHYPKEDEVCTYQYNGQSFEIDDDAIIPLMSRDNPFEDDNALQKVINFVKIVFGEDNLTENLNHIEHCLGKSIEDYLIKDFWKDHKKMYQNRPIYWLFSSKKGAFQVLVYMHRMNPYTVEKIRTKYLLPYIEYLKGRIEADEARGADLTTVERKNLAKMQVALTECTEYHDRLHDVAIKAIDFDLDDGVVVNYAKFGDVVAKLK